MLQVQRRIQGTFSLLMVVICFISSSAYGNSPPIFTSDIQSPIVPENTPVGTVVLKLEGVDPEGSPVKYGIQGTDRFSVDRDSGELRVAEPLDREVNDTLLFNVTLEDEVEGEGVNNNQVEVPMSVIIGDENDNPPVFVNTPYEVVVPEDTPLGQVILDTIKVEDPDLLGESIEVSCKEHDTGEPCNKFVLVPETDSTTNLYTARLTLNSSLNFAQTQFYRLVLVATDGEHISKSNVDIRVGDVQNSPPVFVNASFSGEVAENAPIGFVVLKVEAKDGDLTEPRRIYYDLLTNPGDYLLIDPFTGELKTGKPLDRETLTESNGVISLTVRAREMVDGRPLQEEQATAFAQVTIVLRDVNDSPPAFNKKEYMVTIPENIEDGAFLPDLDMIVTDPDQGVNAAFSLRLEDVSRSFSVEPTTGSGTVQVSIRIKNGSLPRLDYEDPNQRKYIVLVIAEETSTAEKLSSTATLIVQVTDVNDNSPAFELDHYTASVLETAQAGTAITTITAQDADSGDFGTAGILYELVGEHSNKFLVNSQTGQISVGFCTTPGIAPCLDYETTPVYNLTFKATDDSGKGNSHSVPLTINLVDANDNPPQFNQETFSASIEEGVIAFEPRLIIEAMDPDKTSVIEYSLEDTQEELTIDKHTGEITVTSPNGLEIMEPGENLISLVVEATDGMFVSKVPVTIQVLDINNNQPHFEHDTYNVTIPEDVTMGSSIIQLKAHDNDEAINALLSYSIEKGSNNEFNIDNITGTLYATTRLDYDKKDKYSLHVIAVDGGTPPLTGTTTVNIVLLNVNDKEPYFTPTTQRAEVLENIPVGSVVHKLAARDLDIGDPAALRFGWGDISSAVDMKGNEVTSEEYKDLFSIDPTTGWVSVAKPLSRDIAVSIKLGVIVTDQTAPVLQQGAGTLIISIIDVNDIPPEFEPPWTRDEPNYLLEVEEEQPIGSLLGKFTALDKDSSIALYQLEQNGDMFSVNNVTGEVFIESRLDYETIQSVNLTLVAFDSGTPQLSTAANIYVQLININDNSPVFSQAEYNGTVKENAAAGTRILLVSAEDTDLGDLGKVMYDLEGEHSRLFHIDTESGLISVAGDESLDRETVESIRLTAIARDLAPAATQRTATVPVNIKVLDVNDNRPEFKSKRYHTSIQENIIITPSPSLLQLEATDRDENPRLTYRIVSGNDEDVFAVDDAGVLTIQGPLAKGKTEYNLVVQVSDGMLSDTTRVDVRIEPVNLERPVFVLPPPNDSKAFVRENSPIGHLVTKVQAKDEDSGENGRLTYHFNINGTHTQHTAQFSIDPDSGAITTRAALDREEKSSYQVYLVARDHGTPMYLETVQPLLIYIEDEDDNGPMFQASNRTFIFFTKENIPLHTRIGKVQAIDLDEGNNSFIFYFIISGNDNGSFSLDKQDGSIYNEIPLDRELNNVYELFVKASSNENYVENENNYSDNDDSVVLVRILVEDENDNPPEFEQPQYFRGVPSHATARHYVTSVSATDPDIGDFASFSYLIQASHLYKVGSNVSSGSVVPAPFSIDDNGRISTTQPMTEYNQDRFKLEVVARETAPPYREATTLVNVWIYEPQQLIKIILSRPPLEVTAEQDELVRDLSNATDTRVVVDDIRSHVSHTGQIRLDWTDMMVHVVDKQNQEIVAIPHILRIIDSKYDFLKSYYVGVAIENVQPAHPSVQEDKFEPGLAALIALLIVLVVGLVAVCVLCCCCKHWISAESPSNGTPHKSEMLIKKQKTQFNYNGFHQDYQFHSCPSVSGQLGLV
uniref:Cadherin-87A n=2 Tax=Cacopsylla melanoneura TaxID=428564 RepID=A0A8D8SJI2_9HEMI